MSDSRWTAVAGALLLLAGGCRVQPKPPGAPPPAPAAPDCLLLDALTAGGDTVAVALLDEISPTDVPGSRDDSERLLFRQAYETLIGVDCAGRVGPGLAQSWSAVDGGRGWRFVLRPDARFWDGAPVSWREVLRSWERPPGWSSIDSVTHEEDRVFTVYLDSAYERVPALFADPGHAIVGPAIESTWPQGTGTYRIDGPVPSRDFSHLVVEGTPRRDSDAPPIQFRLATLTDARDLVDGGVDVMVTADPDVLDYAGRRADLEVVPLPWDRTYVLLSPTRVRELRARREVGSTLPGTPADLRTALAEDAVREDARAHDAAAWWENPLACARQRERLRATPPAVATAPYRTRGPRRVVYIDGDDAGRALAERIVALATRPVSVEQSTQLADAVPGLGEADMPLLVAGLTAERFDEALRSGGEFLFVAALRSQSLDPCDALMHLADRAPWLDLGRLPPDSSLLPLIDLRQHLIARRGAFALYRDWDGTPLIRPPAREGAFP